MFNIAPQIIETLLADETLVDDFDEVATRCIIGLQRNMADLNCFLLATRGKKPTDKRRETSTGYISNLLFYTAILIHLNDLPPDLYDMDSEGDENSIFAQTVEFDEVYWHSPLILGNHMLNVVTELGEHMWSDEFHMFDDEEAAERAGLSVEAKSTTDIEIPDETGYHEFMANVLSGATQDAEVDEFDSDFDLGDEEHADMLISRFLAGIMIMANLCDIDLGVCMFNASQQTVI